MELKRVVVTGLGALTPIGNTVEEYWNGLINGVSGANLITRFDASKHKTQFACELKNYDPGKYFDRKEVKKLDPYAQYAIIAADEAIADSGLTSSSSINKDKVGVIIASGIGGIDTFLQETRAFVLGDGTPKVSPFFVPKMICDIAAGHVAMKYGFRGPNYATVSACASSTHALVDAFNLIRLGKAVAIVVGGAEAAINEISMGGFNSAQALSTNNENYKTASRPFDVTRDGFVMGEGAGMLVFEEYEHAKARGAKIYAEVGGGGMSADAYHITAPHPEGEGAVLVMKNTLEDANLEPSAVDYINVHGTSTPLGDVAELKAIQKYFGEHAYKLNISSTKSMTGHLLGAAGAVEAIASVLAIVNGIVPPTINVTQVDPEIDPKLNLTLGQAQKREVKVALSNTFGFGGHNSCILFKKL
ncbi:MAG TPA: beta-ketoacyl-ACP synthase II [Bacteroidales bacterium]|nr:beta-ketoacyl-ACP synthase II [Bacteroidales bacterium]HPO65110.1 beta-ketoacyl-ACP synthase II [Bacteroidales bacterium]